MKCPYRNFQECIVEQCPSCNYTEEKKKIIKGIHPAYMSIETAIEKGYSYESIETTYKFVSCKLVDGGVQPIPAQEIHNTQKTNVVVRNSIF